jgi:hypothetical protein
MPRHETGKITQFGWQETPPLRARTPKPADEMPKEDTAAYKLGQQWADETFRVAEQDARLPPVPKPKRSWGAVASWVIGILLVLAFVYARQQQ